MTSLSRHSLAIIIATILLAVAASAAAQSAPNLNFPTVLYGAAYYNEYVP